MDRELYDKVSRWFEEHREEMIGDIIRLVRIPSVSCPQEGEEAPFGEACRDCLEEMLAMGREFGFHTENYGNRVGSIGQQDKDWDHMIGFWNHLDVVPVGNQWTYEPFEPVLKDYFLIGRGAQDNKGPAVGILYMMKCLRELEIPIKHQLTLFVGCDEERGMKDLEYYVSHHPTPRLSMIADSGFPVCYGEKGILEGSLHSRENVCEEILELEGGNASNMIPDAAYVVLKSTKALEEELDCIAGENSNKTAAESVIGQNSDKTAAESVIGQNTDKTAAEGVIGENSDKAAAEGGIGQNSDKTAAESGIGQNSDKTAAEGVIGEDSDKADTESGIGKESLKLARITVEREAGKIRIGASGESRHSAFPEGSVNAVHELLKFLSGLTSLPEKDRKLFGKLAYLSQEYYGEHMGIAGSDEVSGRTTCAATVLKLKEGRVSLHFNIRYVISEDGEKLSALLSGKAEEKELLWETERNSAPNYFPKEHPAVGILTDLYNEITGGNAEAFVMGGGTYARKLPRAFAYGVGGMKQSEEDIRIKESLFLPGHGGAHEPDEGLNVRLLTEAMKIYTMAVIALNDCEI
ncbi:MAG: M20/M25/M40 family metallo-hydrolase [Lachnospiraceae bacterium]|nr:M20/M25/M40 family metallo-hydrolase [Lachnospiraceae bacterium]MCI9676846.1 M20/M25/M40 family metallo-hydrolase [Lachnospiraceae bacterium]